MSQGDEIWTPATVQLLQDAYRSVDPLMTDERFAQDVLQVATRTLYNWRTRPGTKVRNDVQRELNRVLNDAPPEVAKRFLALRPSASSVALTTPPAGALTVYPAALDDAIMTLMSLAGESTGLTHYQPGDLAATVLDWLTSSIGQSADGGDGGGRVTVQNVLQIRTMISAIDTIERTVGGAECRTTAQRYLHTVALPMLQRETESQARSQLFSAVAELCEIVGWMYYDAGQHGTGQAYFTQALRLTREVGDDALSAYLMTTIAHQALHLGEVTAALRVAKTGRNVAESAGSPHVLVEADLLVARSHASLGQARDATVALQNAERSYERSESVGARTWEPQWDDVMFASHAGTCWSNIGNFKEARRLLMHVWDSSAGRPRRLIYSAAELGIAAVRDGQVDLACQHGHDLLVLRNQVDSGRTQENLDRLASELRPFRTAGAVREFFDASGLNLESATK